jgi:hypothetical protein
MPLASSPRCPQLSPPLVLVSGCHRLSLGWHSLLAASLPLRWYHWLTPFSVFPLLPKWKKAIIGCREKLITFGPPFPNCHSFLTILGDLRIPQFLVLTVGAVSARKDITVCQFDRLLPFSLALFSPFLLARRLPSPASYCTAPASLPALRGHSLSSHVYWPGGSSSCFSTGLFFVPPPAFTNSLIGLLDLRLLRFLFLDYPPTSRLQPHPPFHRLAGTQFPLSIIRPSPLTRREKKGARWTRPRAGVECQDSSHSTAYAQAQRRPLAPSRREGVAAGAREGCEGKSETPAGGARRPLPRLRASRGRRAPPRPWRTPGRALRPLPFPGGRLGAA